jgi:hypothetical protein
LGGRAGARGGGWGGGGSLGYGGAIWVLGRGGGGSGSGVRRQLAVAAAVACAAGLTGQRRSGQGARQGRRAGVHVRERGGRLLYTALAPDSSGWTTGSSEERTAAQCPRQPRRAHGMGKGSRPREGAPRARRSPWGRGPGPARAGAARNRDHVPLFERAKL